MDDQFVTHAGDNGNSTEETGSSAIAQKAGIAMMPRVDITPDEQSEAPDKDVYEGTVRLIVDANGRTERMLKFVDELGRNPQFRLLRLVGNYRNKGMDVWLGLREPLHLKTLLLETDGVSEVMDSVEQQQEGDERALKVALAETTGQ